MKSPDLLGKMLVAVGIVILIVLGVVRYHAARNGALTSFDEGGWRVLVPFLGTVCVGGGLFLIALSGGRNGSR